MNSNTEIVEGDVKIAKFMGAIDETGYFQASTIGKTKVPTGRMYMSERFPDNMHLCSEIDLKYHSSWEWLMGVVEKIESIHDDFHGYFGVHISSNNCTIQGTRLNTTSENFHPAYFSDLYGSTKIEATWLAVIYFIKFYNQGKEDERSVARDDAQGINAGKQK